MKKDPRSVILAQMRQSADPEVVKAADRLAKIPGWTPGDLREVLVNLVCEVTGKPRDQVLAESDARINGMRG